MDVLILVHITAYDLGVKRLGQAQEGHSTSAQLLQALERARHPFLQTHWEAGQSTGVWVPTPHLNQGNLSRRQGPVLGTIIFQGKSTPS